MCYDLSKLLTDGSHAIKNHLFKKYFVNNLKNVLKITIHFFRICNFVIMFSYVNW